MSRLTSVARALGPVLLYTGVAIYMTFTAWKGRYGLVGGGDQPDWTGTIWTYWWTAKALASGLNPFVSTLNFYPVGQSPVAQYDLLDAVLAAPFFLGLGAIRGYNAFAALLLATTGWSMDRLARHAGASPWGAALAGLSLELSTYLGLEVMEGRLSQVLLAPALLALLGLDRMARGQGTWKTAVGTGFGVAAAFLTYWYYGLFLVFAGAVLWLAELRRLDARRLKQLGGAALLTALICGPFVLSLLGSYSDLPGVQRPLSDEICRYGVYGRDEFALSMAINQSLPVVWPLTVTGNPLDDHRIALVLLALGLGGVLWKSAGRRRWFWMAAMGYVLAMGPYLKGSDGFPLPWKLPYLYLYDYTPLVDRLWWPERFSVLTWVGLGVLAGLHLDLLLALARRPALKVALVAAALSALAWDVSTRSSYWPMPAEPPRPVAMQVYPRLKGAVITVPVLGEDPSARFLLWFQLFHGQAILSGLGAHLPGHRPVGYESYIHHNSLLHALASISEGKGGAFTVIPEDIQALRDDGFVWAAVDPMAFTASYQAELMGSFNGVYHRLWGQPDISKGGVSVWRVEPIKAPVDLPVQPERSLVFGREVERKGRRAVHKRGPGTAEEGARPEDATDTPAGRGKEPGAPADGARPGPRGGKRPGAAAVDP